MGMNTTVIVLNDALAEIENDRNFGKKLAQAIREQAGHLVCDRVDVPAGNHANAAAVVEQHHSSATAVVAIGGNYGSLLALLHNIARHHTAEDQQKIIRLLKSWIEGFKDGR